MTNQSKDRDYRSSWDRYANIWRLQGAAEKTEECQKVLAPGVVYRDPLTERRGNEELVQYMLEFHAKIPGGHFVTKEFKAHSGRSVARWEMVNGEGAVLGTGISYAEYQADGKLLSATGFFDVPG